MSEQVTKWEKLVEKITQSDADPQEGLVLAYLLEQFLLNRDRKDGEPLVSAPERLLVRFARYAANIPLADLYLDLLFESDMTYTQGQTALYTLQEHWTEEMIRSMSLSPRVRRLEGSLWGGNGKVLD